MIKYECDICGTLNPPADTYGPGVIVAPDMDTLGRGDPMVWYKDMDGVTSAYLSVMPSTDKPSSHVCGGCVKSLLLEMIEAKWPKPYIEGTAEGATPIKVTMFKHSDGLYYPHWPGVGCPFDECPSQTLDTHQYQGYEEPGMIGYKEVLDDENSGCDSPDTDVREVRVEPEVQGTSADGDAGDEPQATYQDLGNCPSCSQPWEHHAGPLCVVPNRHRVVRSSRRGTGEG